ncbi:MAG: hypothetical protein JXQ23_07075, partial [Clostridia bacterium]|nr:hypothetical protein [Clostridia bacterium]
MIYLWAALSLLLFASIAFTISKMRKRRNVQYSLYAHMRSNSIKTNIQNIQKISDAHKLASRNSSPTWTYRHIVKKWKRFRKNYARLYSLQGKYDDLVPVCRWITDNYYLINQNIKQVAKNFNKKNCRRLPAITIDSSDFFPRVYVLAKELMAMMDNNFSEPLMLSLTKAYQEKSPLKISELWALPIMLKICLLDDIAGHTEQIFKIIEAKKEADEYISRLTVEISQKTSVEDILSDITDTKYSDPLGFSSQILLKLRERGFGNHANLNKIA